jgi:hypothetical protein
MMKNFAKEVQNDQKMQQWINKVKQLFNDAVLNPHILDEYQLVQRCESLIDEGRMLLDNNKWREQYQNILNEFRQIFEGIKQDSDVQKLNESAQRVIENFTWVDAKTGQRYFNTNLIGEFRQYLVPLLHKYLEHIPLPPLEGTTDDYDYKFDNLNFSGTDILPDHVNIEFKSQLAVDVPKLETEKFASEACVKITDIRTKLEGVHFWFKRKVIPKMEDHGVADADLSGDGAKITIFLKLNAASNQGFLHVTKCDIDIDKLKINVREAKHQMLLNMITTVFQGAIKRQIETKLEESIKSLFTNIETGLNNLAKKYPPSKLVEYAKEKTGFQTTGGSSSHGAHEALSATNQHVKETS